MAIKQIWKTYNIYSLRIFAKLHASKITTVQTPV